MSSAIVVADLLAACAGRRVALAPEIAGYLVLVLAEETRALPRAVDEENTLLLVDEARLAGGRAPACSASVAQASIRRLLGRLLEHAAGRAPALIQVVTSAAVVGTDTFLAELQSALVPLNREAAARAVARLARDLVRVFEEAELSRLAGEHSTLETGGAAQTADELAARFVLADLDPPPAADRPAISEGLPLSVPSYRSPRPAIPVEERELGRAPLGRTHSSRFLKGALGLGLLLAGVAAWLAATGLWADLLPSSPGSSTTVSPTEDLGNRPTPSAR